MQTAPELLAELLADRYRLLDELGQGGAAVVYLAEDLKHDRHVAIKVLRPVLAAAVGPGRFLREISVTAGLSHPHILPLLDSGEVGEFLYYVMPYVGGKSLRTLLEREGQLAPAHALQIAREVGDALGFAHEHDVVHRDIKPENILFEGGHAVVADFGIALVPDPETSERITEGGACVGTPAYMSPEQASADQAVDHRADIYGLGCVLYEMLAGEPPFGGRTPRVIMARHIADPVPPLSTARPDLAPAIARAVEKALAKAPAGRFQSTRDFLDALTGPDDAEEPVLVDALAVLPFANMSADPVNEYLSDGLSEEIINALAKIEDFKVVARTSSFAFKNSTEDVRTIGRRLGVRSVLEGSLRRAGDRLRVTAQLIDVEDGFHLWSERFDRDMQDVFAIQDEIAQRIADALQVVLRDSERPDISKAHSSNVEAYEFYLRGRQFFHQFRRKSIEFAREMFHRAIDIDPQYALAHAGIADCCSFLYMFWGADPADLEQADVASSLALRINPDAAESHAARGLAFSLRKQYEAAATEFETAVDLNPKLFEAHYFYARACFQSGAFERAAELFERAATVREEDYQAPFFAAQSYAALGREADAHAAYTAALAASSRHLELHPGDARAVTMGGVSLCRIGRREEGLAWAARALAIDPDDAGVSYNVACLFALEGEADRAIDCLEEAVEGGFWHREWAEKDPDLDGIRDHPRFANLLRDLDG